MHERLVDAIKAAIAGGRLAPGHLLPSSRTLAGELGCSRWVVNEAYTQLVAEGHLQARQGSRTRVATCAAPPAPVGAPVAALDPPAFVADLRPGAPDVNSFPTAAWVRSLRHVLTTPAWSPPVFPPAEGVPRLREVVAAYLRRARGIPVGGDEVLITCGASHGTAAVARVLAAVTTPRLAVEDPGWFRLREIAAAAGLGIEPVAVDAAGVDVGAVRRAGVAAVLCAPAHQFPTGTVLSPERRRALLAWAAGHGATIVEDDYDAEFRYDGRPVGALASLGRDHVVYLGTVSKTLHPGLRLGWIVPPPALRRPLLAALAASGGGPGTLEQLTFAHFVETGGYDRHLRRVRRAYRNRRDALVTALDSHPVIRDCGPLHGIAAGLHVTVPLPPQSNDRVIVERLAEVGVAAVPLSRYTIRPQPPALVIGYGRLAPARAAWAADQIANAIHASDPEQDAVRR